MFYEGSKLKNKFISEFRIERLFVRIYTLRQSEKYVCAKRSAVKCMLDGKNREKREQERERDA